MNGEEENGELQALCEAAVEGRLSPEGRRRLEELVLTQPEARRFYAEYLHQHATLLWSEGAPQFLAVPQPLASPVASAPGVKLGALTQPRSPGRRRVWFAAGLAAAASLLVALHFGLRRSDAPPSTPVATLVSGKGCTWGAGTLPTEPGARLVPGRLRLAEGLARVAFDSGAEVTVEAPADLEVVSARRCVLHAGRLVARVPPQAAGFLVDTPTAVLKDLGTEFGVNVRDGATADVQVFEGVVDAQHRGSGRTERMRTGRSLRFAPDAVAEFDPLAEKPAGPAPRAAGPRRRVVHLSTATGRGKDAYVQPLFPSKHHSDVLLLVKNTVREHDDYHRKAYVGIDLAPLAGHRVVEAELSFTFAPTGMGFASEVPDATFAVYGLTDEALDGWDEQAMRWADAPANLPGGAALDPAKVIKIGAFEIVQGEIRGTRSVGGGALARFLNADGNGLATFVLVRETAGSGRSDLVHGFAGREHPTLPPPTLKVTVEPSP